MIQLQRVAIAPAQISGQAILLTPAQQHYLYRVLRLQQGDRFIVLNGRGDWWLAQLTALHEAQILERISVQTELSTSITLLIALPKQGMDDIVRSATELGVACIQPVWSDRTLLRPSPHKVERWRRIVQEAAEQSERQVIPTISDPIPMVQALQVPIVPTEKRFICVARGHSPHLLTRLTGLSGPVSIAIATGPEGGWTHAELDLAIAAEYEPVSLGRRILRATTAPIAALTIATAILERTDDTNE
jgi:16S rRNA (uracil1498-N3)-methyltransferase